jgi:hypothetical protein
VEIRKAPSQKDAILNVIWFWAKRDIERAVRGKPCSDLTESVYPFNIKISEKLTLVQRLLKCMAKNELCVGTQGVLNSSDSVSCMPPPLTLPICPENHFFSLKAMLI